MPGKVYLPEPLPASVSASGPSVRLLWPADLRPPGERGDGTNNVAMTPITVPLPVLYYGDPQLRPSPEAALWRGVSAALAERGAPLETEDPDWSVRLLVIHHRGQYDVSDAQWVSTLTGGTAGKVGAFFYPVFAEVQLHVRVEAWDHRAGRLVVRDVEIDEFERRSLAATWGMWSLWTRSPTTEMFQAAFARAHTRAASEIAALVDDLRRTGATERGLAPQEPALHALKPRWSRADSIAFRGDEELTAEIDALAEAKYGAARFSLLTGHDVQKGDAIGQIALPVDTLAYHVGVTHHQQAQIDLTLLGIYNSFGGGLRTHLFRRGPSLFSAQARAGAYVTVDADRGYRPEIAGMRWSTTLMWSYRPAEVTWFVGAGLTGREGWREVDALDLVAGRAVGLTLRPGFEYQLTSTALLSVSLQANADFRDDVRLGPRAVGPLSALPVLAIGLR